MRPPEASFAMGPDVASLATTLRGAGYATGLSGKWHIAENLRRRDGGKYFDRYGFDFCGDANCDRTPCAVIREGDWKLIH
ncbi:MAG: hypothetical protein WCF18_25255 [Chthoniobacteraceae bacterium]